MSNGIAGIYSEIYTRLASNKTLFPALPETTIRLRETLNDPNCTIASAAKLLNMDPGLSTFILRIANSVRFMSLFPPKDLEGALRRIGLASATELATTFAIKGAFTTSSGALKSLMVESYRQATRVAIISYFLAAKVSKINPSKAMLAGLLQDIGLPLILLQLYERPEVFNDRKRRLEAVDQLAPMVGALILQHWGFNKEFIEMVRCRKQWQRDTGKKADLGDLLLIARIHASIGHEDFTDCPSIPDIPAFYKFPLGKLTPDQSLEILAEASEELDELQQMFG
ncbi:MAG: HDOD domain-containing protein [Gammaproteobacteria bacterium]|nr:HDOD domain-containing protein [Gammaproteobacteria bacterium]